MPSSVEVKVTFDEEAGVWFTASTDAPGLHVEAETLELLFHKLPGAVADLFEATASDRDARDRSGAAT
jgi:hypothetical protein